jgi:protein-S-isoprenylcysteine O-methyltransferase Ste14
VTTGPYSVVRNPIYTGLWALQLATTIAFSSWIWWGLVPISTAIYYVGTMVRVRREENLLREQFGPAFDEYVRRVPALLPLGGGSANDRPSGANA